MLTMIKQKVPTVYPFFTQDILAAKLDGDLIDCMEAVFKNLRMTYLKKDQERDLDSDADNNEDDEVLHKQRNCCWQRKTRVSNPALAQKNNVLTQVQKAEERMRAATDYNIDISKLGWFFMPAYQSTDELDTIPVLDPNTNVEEGNKIQGLYTPPPVPGRILPESYHSYQEYQDSRRILGGMVIPGRIPGQLVGKILHYNTRTHQDSPGIQVRSLVIN